MNEDDKPFPVLRAPPGCASFIKWSALDDRQARVNHSQTLERLAERGGLSPVEIFGNINRIKWRDLGGVDKAAAVELVNRLAYEGVKHA